MSRVFEVKEFLNVGKATTVSFALVPGRLVVSRVNSVVYFHVGRHGPPWVPVHEFSLGFQTEEATGVFLIIMPALLHVDISVGVDLMS